jgi:glycogen phosphorylase
VQRTQPHSLYQRLPREIAGLGTLAIDLHWTWNHATDELWERVDAGVWRQTGNPILVLQNASLDHLEALTADADFRTDLARALEAHDDYLERASWFTEAHADAPPLNVAYFSMEYGLNDALPIYSGGLGVLAGDHLKTASDLGVPVTAMGLLFHEGYFRQLIDSRGAQLELYTHNGPESLPIEAVLAADGAPLRIELELPGRVLRLKLWRACVGRVGLYLLDSDDPLNRPVDRAITSKLYGGDRETRLMQEIVLGIGGWRAFEALGIDVDVCHLNEGHAAFVTLERARCFAKNRKIDFWEALWATRGGNILTTHTPVAAAFDTYPFELLAKYGRDYAADIGIDPDQLVALGRSRADADEPFNMAYLAARTCARTNAVSALHGEVSRRIFASLYPRWPEREIPVTHVTNGVHVPSWDSAWADVVWTEACGKQRWLHDTAALEGAVGHMTDDALWNFRADERRDLIEYSRQRLALQLGERGAPAAAVAIAADVLDPNALTLGFARRFTEYKRPDLLLRDPERLARLLAHADHPVQLIVAGKAHPHDPEGKAAVRRWVEFAQRPDVRAHVVFLEDYDMSLAEQLVQGVDVWINTPRRPWEACGTSGMKVLVNGGLNLSSLDGWWAEAYDPSVGWALNESPEAPPGARDADDALELYRLLEEDVVPQFYERDAAGVPRAWVQSIRASMARLVPTFSSNRMLTEYLERLYLPAASDHRLRCLEHGERAHALRDWLHRLRHCWQQVHWGDLTVTQEADGWTFAVQLYLGGLAPDDVEVQLFADPGAGVDGECHDMSRSDALAGATGGYRYTARLWTHRLADAYTPRVIPSRALANVPAEANFISWRPRG